MLFNGTFVLLIWKIRQLLMGLMKIHFTDSKKDAEIALLGSKPFQLDDFPKLEGFSQELVRKMFQKKRFTKGILVRYPSKKTIELIYEETASFTCGLIFKMLYSNIGTIIPWEKEPRSALSSKKLLIIGTGNIGTKVSKLMKNFMKILTFDSMVDKYSDLKLFMQEADCITIHILILKKNYLYRC